MVTLPPLWAACSNASGEEIHPNIQPEPLLVQSEAITSHPPAVAKEKRLILISLQLLFSQE